MDIPIAVHYADGRVLKGTTTNFHPKKDSFHMLVQEKIVAEVFLKDLKAVFFVRSLEGDPERDDAPGFGEGYGRPISVVFHDGEELEGRAQSSAQGSAGFFLLPGDGDSNNERIFCVRSAIKELL